MRAQVILARHGATDFNDSGNEKVRGFVDLALNEKGQREAVELAAKLSTMPIALVYCSPLLRARQTARQICKSQGAPLIMEKALLPWMCGKDIQGHQVSQVLPKIKFYAAHPLEVPNGGESFKTFTDRYLSFLWDVIDRARNRSRDICLVCHSRCLQLTRAWEKKGRPKDFSYDVGVMNDYSQETPPGEVLVLDVDVVQKQ